MAKFLQLAVYVLCLAGAVLPQTPVSGAAGDAEGIRISAQVEPRQVPLNRTATLTVRLEWTGDLDRYEVQRFDNPLMENFNILTTSSANRVQVINGRQVAVQEYYFTLKPEVLGMAYVDGLVARYTDSATGKEYRLFANRLEAKAIDPLPEPGQYAWILWLAAGSMVVAGGAYLFWQQRQKKRAAKLAAEAQKAAVQTVEQRFHSQLRGAIDLRSLDLDVETAFAQLSRLVRLYLAEKFTGGPLGQTTSELISVLKSSGGDERLAADAEEILNTADVVKFSGTAVSRDKLERMYTLFESWLTAPKTEREI